jgi:hypothetical protein
MAHRTYRLKYFLMGATFSLLLSATVGFANKYQNDEKELKRIRAVQTKQAEVQKVRDYYLSKNPKLWGSLAQEMAEATVEAATAYQIPLDVQVGINACESEIDPFAVSTSGAKGMGQVDFRAWADCLGKGNPFEPRYNQHSTSYILAANIRKFGLKKGLEVYNLGEGSFSKGRRNPRYVKRVYEAASEFRYFEVH